MHRKIIAKIALGLPLTKKEQAVYELIIKERNYEKRN